MAHFPRIQRLVKIYLHGTIQLKSNIIEELNIHVIQEFKVQCGQPTNKEVNKVNHEIGLGRQIKAEGTVNNSKGII